MELASPAKIQSFKMQAAKRQQPPKTPIGSAKQKDSNNEQIQAKYRRIKAKGRHSRHGLLQAYKRTLLKLFPLQAEDRT